MHQKQVLIIGGGISGLSTAWWLARRGISVELWEAANQPGGKIQSTRESGYLTERAAGLLVNHRPEIDQVINEADLDSVKSYLPEEVKRYILRHGHLTHVPMKAHSLLLSNLWSRQTKRRLLAEILIPRGNNRSESVSSFISRRLGKEILETAIEPFIAGTLGSDADQASAEAVLPRLTELERRYGSITLGMLVNRLIKRNRLNRARSFSFRNGMSELTDNLSTCLGVNIRCGMKTSAIERYATGWIASAEFEGDEHRMEVPHLVLSTPADVSADIVRDCNNRLGALLGTIDYAPLAVLHLGFQQNQIRQPLDGTGFLVPRREYPRFNGNLWMSALFPDRAPRGHALLSSYLGGSRHPEQLDQDDQSMTENLLSDLSGLLGIRGLPDYVRVDRHSRALPLYHGDYQDRLARIGECLDGMPGLYLAASYIDGVSVRERIYQGMKTAKRIEAALELSWKETRRERNGGEILSPIKGNV
ncbi:MAG: protoporphyrinogen oxidase [Gammaproteobacteria bacterium]|nr:protoporphyrinogen oxidase [Gammaproteobacteria bacterium]